MSAVGHIIVFIRQFLNCVFNTDIPDSNKDLSKSH